MKEFEEAIQYTYQDKNWMVVALTHSSFANEGRKGVHDNERMEFLGDSVLSVVVSEHLFFQFKHQPEGELTKLRAALVCEQSLYGFAKQIHLGNYIRLGKGEENTGGRDRPSILSDAFEAVIASIYLDGGFEEAQKFILRFLPKHLDVKKVKETSDYKTALQEIIQKNKEETLQYVLTDERGPDHDKQFTVQVLLNSNVIGTGIGKSKKNAEQMAAKEALALMGYET